MVKKVYNKLIRDGIPEIIRRKSQKPEVRKLKDEEFERELKRKILEEGKELIEGDEKNIINELADLQEIIDTLLEIKKFSKTEFKKFQREKRKKHGGFKKQLFLISVNSKE